jgi:hypothetical protein
MFQEYEWSTEQLVKLVPGATVNHYTNAYGTPGTPCRCNVLKAPMEDSSWCGGWRVYLEFDEECFSASIASMDPDSIEAPALEGQSLIKHAHKLKAECDILAGQVVAVQIRLIEEFLQDITMYDAIELSDKYEDMLDALV